ncbi:hypothetical protein AVEN_261137-1 [Araneus ventricosus]|uniref:Peptidase aspartic putative domain-containing protein n=1 Tax=Araneus ventricosus TaxID=182803 RepID=A0A4Y2J0S8_ARAVE|nr:hypothetical protein AVEN_261137-1 [Araneus ventricosus]
MDKDEPKERTTRLKIARGRVKASLTRLENTAEDLMLKNEILISLQRLEELVKEYEKLDAEISFEDSKIVEFEVSDEDFSRPSECDIILGSDCFFTTLRNGGIIGSEGQPIAQSTMFG